MLKKESIGIAAINAHAQAWTHLEQAICTAHSPA
jgi:hypothetical protein